MYYIRIDLSKKELKRAKKLAIIASMRKILLLAQLCIEIRQNILLSSFFKIFKIKYSVKRRVCGLTFNTVSIYFPKKDLIPFIFISL